MDRGSGPGRLTPLGKAGPVTLLSSGSVPAIYRFILPVYPDGSKIYHVLENEIFNVQATVGDGYHGEMKFRAS